MAGLAPYPDRFFKYLFILVLYSLALVQFVSIYLWLFITKELSHRIEFRSCRPVQERRYRDPTLVSLELVHDDLRRFL